MKPSFSLSEIPFLRFLLPVTAGITIAIYLPATPGRLSIHTGILFTATASLVTCLLCYRRLGLYRHKWLPGMLIHAIICLGTYARTVQVSGRLDPNFFAGKKFEQYVVNISSEPVENGPLLRIECAVNGGFINSKWVKATGNLLVLVNNYQSGKVQLRFGDQLLLPAKPAVVPAAYNPAEFDYGKLLGNRQIYYQQFIDQTRLYLIRRDQGNYIVAKALLLRERMVAKYNRYITQKDAAALASALILGYRATLDREIVNAYASTGTTHVLSVSGMHVGIVFIVLLFCLKFMDRHPLLKILRALLIIALVAGYAVLTGLSSAVCRAAVMLIFVVIGQLVGRKVNSINLLAISAFLLLIYQPFFLLDAGFQLSYLAMIGLFYVYPLLYDLVSLRSPYLDKLWSCVAVSIAAQLTTFPLSVYYFHQFPVWFIVSNLFILLPVTAILYLGILFLFIPWDFPLHLMGSVLKGLIFFMNHGLVSIERLPFSLINGIWLNAFSCLLLYALLGCIALAFVYRRSIAVFPAMLISIVLFTNRAFGIIQQATHRQVIFYSIRKHLAIGFINGNSGYVLTDLEVADRSFTFSVAPSFSSAGINLLQCIAPGRQFKATDLLVANRFIQFRNWRMMMIDKGFVTKNTLNPVTVDLVFLAGNAKIDLDQLLHSVHFSQLVINGTVSNYQVMQWKQEAARWNIPIYILKENPAFIVPL